MFPADSVYGSSCLVSHWGLADDGMCLPEAVFQTSTNLMEQSAAFRQSKPLNSETTYMRELLFQNIRILPEARRDLFTLHQT